MIAILKREWKSYFQNITGWLFIAAVLALYGLYFLAYNLRAGYPYVSYTLSAISFIMLIAVPILTMRSMAEERHSRTDQLVLTAPVSLGKMIFGKFLAMVGVFTVAVAVIAVTPLVLAAFGTVPMGENYVAVLGFWLFVSYFFQTYGLKYTTASKNAFITTLYVILVPFINWGINRLRPGKNNLFAAVAAVIGLALITLEGDLGVNRGDVLTLIEKAEQAMDQKKAKELAHSFVENFKKYTHMPEDVVNAGPKAE